VHFGSPPSPKVRPPPAPSRTARASAG
jgi:hypothetical protein